MRTLMIVVLAVSILATPALASRTYEFNWATGEYTCIATFNNCTPELSSSMNNPAHAGNALQLTKTNFLDDGYATALVACAWGLLPGDQVTASFWRYDNNVGYPRLRLWAHYNDNLGTPDYRDHDLQAYDGLAYGNNSFGNENGWELAQFTWTIPAGHTGLVIDAILYGEYGSVYYVDEFSITVPDHAYAQLPGTYYDADGSPTAVEVSTWGNLKVLFE